MIQFMLYRFLIGVIFRPGTFTKFFFHTPSFFICSPRWSKMETDVSFGLWLEKRRKSLDLTREELANKIGSSVSALRKIESDERRPSKQLAELLANALDIPTD